MRVLNSERGILIAEGGVDGESDMEESETEIPREGKRE